MVYADSKLAKDKPEDLDFFNEDQRLNWLVHNIQVKQQIKLLNTEKKAIAAEGKTEQAPIDKEEASRVFILTSGSAIKQAFELIKADISKQIEIANKIVTLLKQEIEKYDFDKDIITTEAQLLKAVFLALLTTIV